MSTIFSEISSMNKKCKQFIVRTMSSRMCHKQMCRAVEKLQDWQFRWHQRFQKMTKKMPSICHHVYTLSVGGDLGNTKFNKGMKKYPIWLPLGRIYLDRSKKIKKPHHYHIYSTSHWIYDFISVSSLLFSHQNICPCCELRLFNFAPRRIVRENCKIKWKLLWFNCSDFNESSST